jgi:hypothetical protein
MLSAMDSEFEPNPDDEREVDLSDESEPPAPLPTLDPEERIEDTDDEDAPRDEDREV